MNWQDIPRNPDDKTLRQFAGMCLLFFGGFGIYQLRPAGDSTLGMVLLGAAVLIGLPGLVRPRLLRWIFVGWIMAVFPIGWTISNVVLAILFYLIFTPLGLAMRALSRDTMRLDKPDGPSFWEPKSSPEDVRQYSRQS